MTRSEPNISQRVDEPSAIQSSFEEVMRYWHTQIHSEWGESVEFHKVDTGWYLILLYTCITTLSKNDQAKSDLQSLFGMNLVSLVTR